MGDLGSGLAPYPRTSVVRTTRARCADCDLPRPEPRGGEPRTPCRACGATALTYSVTISVSVTASVSARMSLTPGDQDLGWRNRWTDIQRSLDQLDRPRTGPCSGEGIEAAAHELMRFYATAYHLKDLLKIETPIPDRTIEDAIDNTPSWRSSATSRTSLSTGVSTRGSGQGWLPRSSSAKAPARPGDGSSS